MLGFLSAALAVPPTPISAVEAVSTVRPYLIKLLRFMFFLWLVYLLLSYFFVFLSAARFGLVSAGQIFVKWRVSSGEGRVKHWLSATCHLPPATCPC
jgi:hypothetical protein